MTETPNEPQTRILRALRDGGELVMHARSERGPYYTLNGRRVSVVTVKEMEGARWIERDGGMGRGVVRYELTKDGREALERLEGS